MALILFLLFFLPATAVEATDSAVIDATAKTAVCGNNIVEAGEECDTSNLAGKSCTTLGLPAGALACSPACEFNTASCGSSGGGGGGGGGGSSKRGAEAIFRGFAYPGSLITLTKDGSAILTAPSGPDAQFEVTATGLNMGSYTFGISAKDKNGRASVLKTFPISLTPNTSVVTSGIFIPPSISVDKSEVKKGEILTILGETVPAATVTVYVRSENEIIKSATADAGGAWIYKLDTGVLNTGDHSTQARAATSTDMTDLSPEVRFRVGGASIAAFPADFLPYDLNRDFHVDIVDFSIIVYWWGKTSPPEEFDFNRDAIIDLTDLSILAFYWTG